MSDSQKKAFLITESLILSGPLLLIIGIFLCLGIPMLFFDSARSNGLVSLFICTFFILIVLLPNILFFSVLKNKLNMGIETFWYDVGFLSNIIIIHLVCLKDLSNAYTSVPEEVFFSFLLIILLFNSLFYTYAAILKNTEKRNNKTIFFLMTITIVFFAAFIIENFEILKQYFGTLELSYQLGQSVLFSPILLGLYTGYFAVYRTIRISLRNAAWGSFLMIFTAIVATLFLFIYGIAVINYRVLYPLLAVYETPPDIYYAYPAVYYFLFSFAVSCLVGIVYKRLKKNQRRMRTSE